MYKPEININNYFESFRKGDEKGFTYFFNRYRKALCFFAFSYVKDLPVAEDIVAEVFINTWTKRERIKTKTDLKSYLFRSVTNRCLNSLRREKRAGVKVKNYMTIAETEEKTIYESIVQAETVRLLHIAINSLPKQCRQVFIKLFIEEKSVAEIAAEMQLTQDTIRNQKARGKKLIRVKLHIPVILYLFCILIW